MLIQGVNDEADTACDQPCSVSGNGRRFFVDSLVFNEARHARSRYIASLVPQGLRWIRSKTAQIIHWAWLSTMTWRARRTTQRALEELEDHQLKDIGLSRSNIPGAAARVARIYSLAQLARLTRGSLLQEIPTATEIGSVRPPGQCN